MKKLRLFCILFALLNVVNVWGQVDYQQQVDSLWKVIKNSAGEEKLKSYADLHTLFFNNVSDDASLDVLLNFSKEYDKYAQQQGDIKIQGDIRINNIIIYERLNKWSEFEKAVPQTLKFLKKNNLTDGYYFVYRILIVSYCDQNRFEEALEELQAVYSEVQQQNDLAGAFYIEQIMGMTYMYQDRLDEAETYYRKSIKTAEMMSEKPHELIHSYLELCNMLQAISKFDDFFILAKQTETLIEQLEKEATTKDCTIEKNNLYVVYAYAYKALGEFDHAEYYCHLLDSLSRSRNAQRNTNYIRSYIMEAQGEYEKALEYINRNIELDPSYSYSRIAKIRILLQIENAPLAWAEVENTLDFLDSVRTATFNGQLDELRTQYEVDRHIAEKERNRNYFLFALGGCLLLAIALGIWIYYSRTIVRKNRNLYRQIKEQDRLAEELETMTKQYDQMPDSVVETGRAPSLQLPGNKQQRQLVSHLREFLLKDRHFAEYDIDLQKLASEMATNRASLFEAIKSVTEKTPMEFINDLRLDEAKRLLEHSDLTREIIAFDCGFNTSRTFYRQFRERYHITPAEYRKIATSSAVPLQ
jgi:AraC-like DNA-binding protein